jgi:hypothetical protein
VPFVNPEIVYDSVVAEESDGGSVYGMTDDHWYGAELELLYCKLYDVMGRPPLAGTVQLIVLTVFWFDVEEVIPGARGTVDGVAVFAVCVEFVACDEYGPWPLTFTAATWK